MQNQIVKYRKILINVSKDSKKDARRYASKVSKRIKSPGAEYMEVQNLTAEKEEKEILPA